MYSAFYRVARASAFSCLASLLLEMGAGCPAMAQETNPASAPAQAGSAQMEQVPRVPGVSTVFRGFNAGFTLSGVHNSSIGWYNIVTPAAGYTISPHYSADASLSIYPYRLAQSQQSQAVSSQGLTPALGDIGDIFIGLHARWNPHVLQNTATAAFTIPTGNRADGLGTGKVTFDFRDHMERYAKQTGFLLDVGAGDSSGLFNRLVANTYTSLGSLAHFQAGISLGLHGRASIQSAAYEQLPFGKQTLYTNPGPPGSPSVNVTSGNKLGRDNGVTTSLDLPLSTHITLSGYYNRSFQQDLDTVSVGVTYVLRGRPAKKRLSMIDRALREAERDEP